MAVALARQQVGRDRPPDELVPEVNGVSPSLMDHAVRDGLGETRPRDRRRGPSPRRGSDVERGGGRRSAVELVGRRDVGQLGRGERPAAGASKRSTRRHSGERSPSRAITRSSSEPVSDGPTARAGRQQLLGDEWVPPRRSATRTSPEPVGRSPSIASMRSASSLRSSGSSVRRAGGRRASMMAASRGKRVGAGHLVGLVARDEAHPVGPLDPGQECREGSGRGIGVVEILEDEEDRLALAEPAEDPQDPFEDARLAPLRRGDRSAGSAGRRHGPAGRGAPA